MRSVTFARSGGLARCHGIKMVLIYDLQIFFRVFVRDFNRVRFFFVFKTQFQRTPALVGSFRS